MAVGSSGRIVIEIDPELKVRLYEALKDDDLRLKEWFLEHVNFYLKNRVQLSLEFDENSDPRLRTAG